ncbi:transcriptional regulator TbsP [Halomarina oriensis]|uniref:Transcriptional regulator n=1 Tax=Halomarina oriensis TaxID=671145 RepID=A0A6B0GX70_9EURY|nr:DUF5821 family protein [Halomarina oriensis]MWG36735.1 hypothetical protein [Halomarina oriensis]
MSSNVLESSVESLLTTALADVDGTAYLVNPDAETFEALVEGVEEDDDVSVRLFGDERMLKDVLDDFIVASTAANLMDAGRLELRVLDEPSNTLLVTGEHVMAIVDTGDHVAGLTTDDDAFVESATEQYAAAWDEASQFNLRTPAITRVRQSLSDDIGPDVAEDFDTVLASMETARGDGDGLDEVTISLLVAAKNEELLYDISKWGEDVGIASKATFSRTKTRLEELGLIDTEKVPIDVGRPRLRLVLGDDRLRGADSGELANVAQSLMAS